MHIKKNYIIFLQIFLKYSLFSCHKESENIIDNIHSKITDKSSDINYYSFEERLLLAWLSYHYEEGRKQEWMTDFRVVLNPYENKDMAEARNIKNFDKDLSDSLVLITVTAAYCPFLIEESLNNIYIQPRNYEDVLYVHATFNSCFIYTIYFYFSYKNKLTVVFK